MRSGVEHACIELAWALWVNGAPKRDRNFLDFLELIDKQMAAIAANGGRGAAKKVPSAFPVPLLTAPEAADPSQIH